MYGAQILLSKWRGAVESACCLPECICRNRMRRAPFISACLHALCGEVEDVVGVLTPVCRGVAQVFHDLLIELRLLLVAEVRGKGRQTGGRLRSRESSQRERQPCVGVEMDVKCGQDST